MVELLTPQQFKFKCESEKYCSVHPFVHELLAMDQRIRMNEFFGDVESDKGYFITKNTIHIPYNLPAIQHDIAHLLEMRDCRRWTIPDWGMPRFEKESMPKTCVFAALARETRTRAIQLHLTRFSCEEAKLSSFAFNQLNNPYWKKLVISCLPFGRFKEYREVNDWVCYMRERTYQAWSLDRIHFVWMNRLEHIQNWMETSAP